MTEAPRRNTDPGPGRKASGDGLNVAHIRSVLTTVLNHVAPLTRGVEYRVVGTAASALHGARVPVGDIDLLFRKRQDVDRFGAALASLPVAECLFPPTDLRDARQYFARYLIDGAMVELSTVEVETESDTRECIGRGPWQHYSRVACGKHVVPAVALELRLLTELGRNRPDRHTPITDHMRQHGCDLDLVRRGLANMRGLPEPRQREILDQLGAARSPAEPSGTAPDPVT
jgi:hypothetical protein